MHVSNCTTVSKSYEEEDTCLRVSHMRRRIHAQRIHACE